MEKKAAGAVTWSLYYYGKLEDIFWKPDITPLWKRGGYVDQSKRVGHDNKQGAVDRRYT